VSALEGEVEEAREVRDTAEANFHNLSVWADELNKALEDAEGKCQSLAEELTLLQARGSELCSAIIGPSTVQGHLSDGMVAAAARHTKMAGQLAVLRGVVLSAVRSLVGRMPSDAALVDALEEAVTQSQEQEGRLSRLQASCLKVCDLILGPPAGRVRLTDRLEQATERFQVERVERWEAIAELHRSGTGLGAWQAYGDIFPGGIAGYSRRADPGPDRRRCYQWGPLGDPVGVGCHRVALPELEPELEVLGSGRNMDAPEEEMAAI
jgi:hypothetical protein